MAELLHVRLLGTFGIAYGGQPVAGFNPRLQALLAYLLLHSGAPLPRQQVAFLFWPDSTGAQARTNLRQLLHTLKQVLPATDEFVQAGPQSLEWRAEAPLRLDVAEFDEALARAAAERKIGLHAAGGDRAGVVRVYHTCAAGLRREQAVELSAATRRHPAIGGRHGADGVGGRAVPAAAGDHLKA